MKTYLEDHMKMIQEAKEELEAGTKVEIKHYSENLDSYDTFFLGIRTGLHTTN